MKGEGHVKGEIGRRTVYRLGYPNLEVREGLNRHLLRALVPHSGSEQARLDLRLLGLLEAGDFAGLEALFRSYLAGIPYEWHTNNRIGDYEGYYASVFYSWFAALGVDVRAEDSSSRGRVDLAVRHAGRVYLFEFKTVESTPSGVAMRQLKEKGYAEKYRGSGEPIHLVAVELSREARNVASFEAEPT